MIRRPSDGHGWHGARDTTMPLSEYITRSRTLVLQAITKEGALKELVAALCRDDSELDQAEVLRAIVDREQSVSSRIGSEVALPHALVPGYHKQMLAAGYCPAGIAWDSPSEPPVTLVVMSLSGDDQAGDHIRMLAELARSLRDPAIMGRMSSAASAEQIYEILRGPLEVTSSVAADGRKLHVSRSLVSHALAMVKEAHADALMILVGDAANLDVLEEKELSVPLILVTDDSNVIRGQTDGAVLEVPLRGLRRTHRVKLAFLFALSHGLIDKGDTVICLSGDSSIGMLHAMDIVDVAEEFNVLLSLRAQLKSSDISEHVLDRVLQVAAALAREGREGTPVGAIFVLGDYDSVQRRCHQLVMNPFRGYPENERSVLDPSLEETIKEFSRIDGAFLIRGDGVIMSVGSYIQTEKPSESLESGLGARHAAAMAITMTTRAMSIVISESTRRISLFKQGRLILALDQALR